METKRSDTPHEHEAMHLCPPTKRRTEVLNWSLYFTTAVPIIRASGVVGLVVISEAGAGALITGRLTALAVGISKK